MPFYQKLVIPDEKDLYVVSDIHGMYALYKEGCKRLGVKDSDVVISLGDLCDRGKENLQTFLEFTQKENRYMVLGNHEDLMMQGLSSRDHYYCWFMNGGNTTLDELGEEGIEVVCKWLTEKPVVLEVEHRGKKLGFIHGGIPSYYQETGLDFEDITWEDVIKLSESERGRELLMWERDTLKSHYAHKQMPRYHKQIKPVSGIDYVFHGHSYVAEPLYLENRIYTDTGSVFNGKICFSWLDGDQLRHYLTGEDD